MLDHGSEQSGFAFEVSMDQAFRTTSGSGDFASGSCLVTLGREKSKGGVNESLPLGGSISLPFWLGSVFASGKIRFYLTVSLALAFR
jgi:hypothetical protein